MLVFDFGVGGLLVYDKIRRPLPDLYYIYAFDNVVFPHREKSEEFIVEHVVEIVAAVQQRYPPSLAAIARNTASTVLLPALRERFVFLVVGVVPAIRPVVRLTANGVVGLLAICAMMKRLYIHELITRLASERQIAMLGSAELVELTEARLHGETVSLEELRRILCSWLRMSESSDIVVFGRTHFPLLREELLQVPPKGAGLVDPGAAIVRRTAWLLKHEALDAKLTDENTIFYMAMTIETEQSLPVLQRYDFKALEKLSV